MKIEVVNQNGRRWCGRVDLDKLRYAMPATIGNYSVVTENGAPLFGSAGHSSETSIYIARGWTARAASAIS